MITIQMA